MRDHAAIARELTKAYETFLTGDLASLQTQIQDDSNQQKGEFVVVVQGYQPDTVTGQPSGEAQQILLTLLRELPLKKAAALTAEITGVKKNALYQWGLAQKGRG